MLLSESGFDFIKAFEINGVHTEFVVQEFANKILIIITQFGKIRFARNLNYKTTTNCVSFQQLLQRQESSVQRGQHALRSKHQDLRHPAAVRRTVDGNRRRRAVFDELRRKQTAGSHDLLGAQRPRESQQIGDRRGEGSLADGSRFQQINFGEFFFLT